MTQFRSQANGMRTPPHHGLSVLVFQAHPYTAERGQVLLVTNHRRVRLGKAPCQFANCLKPQIQACHSASLSIQRPPLCRIGLPEIILEMHEQEDVPQPPPGCQVISVGILEIGGRKWITSANNRGIGRPCCSSDQASTHRFHRMGLSLKWSARASRSGR